MWNSFKTDEYDGMIAETISLKGYNNDVIRAYYSRPLTSKPYPGIVLIPHMPGWDEFCRECARRFTQHGYAVLCPDIYCRVGSGTPTEVAAKAREQGGVSDDCVMGDTRACLEFLKDAPVSNEKVGVIGMCSGGRHAFLAACTVEGFDAAVDCWGGGVVVSDPSQLTPSRPVAPIDYSEKLNIPLLGIFGNDDHSPTPEDVNKLEETLKKLGKDYDFYRYDGAGHGFWYYDKPMYRQQQAMDSFDKVIEFFDKHLKD
ncbi:MAG: dienelactone hydrolase family protein [Erysipelotrichaceae bacterium]|nr:dienelactone hydrolase family protein [Erysipelotrichaceae bacterium]